MTVSMHHLGVIFFRRLLATLLGRVLSMVAGASMVNVESLCSKGLLDIQSTSQTSKLMEFIDFLLCRL